MFNSDIKEQTSDMGGKKKDGQPEGELKVIPVNRS